jgi:hypothetical protein
MTTQNQGNVKSKNSQNKDNIWRSEAAAATTKPEQQQKAKRDSSLRSERVTLFRETRILSRNSILFSIDFRAKSKKSQPLRMTAQISNKRKCRCLDSLRDPERIAELSTAPLTGSRTMLA